MSRNGSSDPLLALGRCDPVDPGAFRAPPLAALVDERGASVDRARTPIARCGPAVASTAAIAVVLLVAVLLVPKGSENAATGGGSAALIELADAATRKPALELEAGEVASRAETVRQAVIPGNVVSISPGRLDLDQSSQPGQVHELTIHSSYAGPNGRDSVSMVDGGSGVATCSDAESLLSLLTPGVLCAAALSGTAVVGPEAGPPAREALRQLGERGALLGWSRGGSEGDVPDPYPTDAGAVDALLADRAGGGPAAPELAELDRGGLSVHFSPQGGRAQSASRLLAAAKLLANPLAPPRFRSLVFGAISRLPGIETSEPVDGGNRVSVSVTEPAPDPSPVLVRVPKAGISEPFTDLDTTGFRLDLSGLRLRTELIFDASSSELVSERTELVAADDPVFGPWLEQRGAPQPVSSKTLMLVGVAGKGNPGG